jgi:hypothetical protein
MKRAEMKIGCDFFKVPPGNHAGWVSCLVELCHIGFHSLRFGQVHGPVNRSSPGNAQLKIFVQFLVRADAF